MKRKIGICCLLAAALLALAALGGCGQTGQDIEDPGIEDQVKEDNNTDVGSAENDTENEPDIAPEPQTEGSGTEATGTPAVTNGRLIYTMDFDQGILDGSRGSGWFITSRLSKGYGTQSYAIAPDSGKVIEGEEGAEVVLCQNGLVRFVWKDEGGSEVSAYNVYFMEGAPQVYTLYARVYDLEGTMLEERELLSWTQAAEDPYFTIILPAMEKVIAELGGGSVSGMETMLEVTQEGVDAVILDGSGSELIRLPGVSSLGIEAYASRDGGYVSVYRPDSDQTEFYLF